MTQQNNKGGKKENKMKKDFDELRETGVGATTTTTPKAKKKRQSIQNVQAVVFRRHRPFNFLKISVSCFPSWPFAIRNESIEH